MPDIKKFFASSKVSDWSSRTFTAGGGGGGKYASGGTSADYTESGKTYVAHTFTGSGYFEVEPYSTDFDVEVLVVAGGGGGGGYYGMDSGGGGGGGGARALGPFPVSATGGSPDGPGSDGKYQITIGAGGTGNTPSSYCTPGTNSQWGNSPTAEASGGGAGGAVHPDAYPTPWYDTPARPNPYNYYHPYFGGPYPYYNSQFVGYPGGSSGGAGYGFSPQEPYPLKTACTPWMSGNAGGYSPVEGYPAYQASGPAGSPYGYVGRQGSGGGGAGGTFTGPGAIAAGNGFSPWYSTTTPTSGHVNFLGPATGGPGLSNTYKDGSTDYYGGGGGAGGYNDSPTGTYTYSAGGTGGGGAGNYTKSGSDGNAGTVNTGGGGGGVGYGPARSSGAGGSGTIIVRYALD